MLPTDSMQDSHFSFLRWNSESGEAELRLAEKYDEASIFSVGASQPQSDDFVKKSSAKGVKNAWRFTSPLLAETISAFTSSPEFVRYQVCPAIVANS